MSGVRVWRIGVAVTDERWERMRTVYGLKRYFWADTVPMAREDADALVDDINNNPIFRVVTIREAA